MRVLWNFYCSPVNAVQSKWGYGNFKLYLIKF